MKHGTFNMAQKANKEEEEEEEKRRRNTAISKT